LELPDASQVPISSANENALSRLLIPANERRDRQEDEELSFPLNEVSFSTAPEWLPVATGTLREEEGDLPAWGDAGVVRRIDMLSPAAAMMVEAVGKEGANAQTPSLLERAAQAANNVNLWDAACLS
jgi:hypothetical protein